MKKKYKISVVMPIYNTAQYLSESIGSVINQTIGFEENVQLILVNDGSPDNADEICRAYKEKYPDNIVYVPQENQGVSYARNNGMTYVEGEYVNFFDSDDIWEPDVFQIVYDFAKQHRNEIDVISCMQKYFEAKTGFHSQSKKFEDGDRVIDIHQNPEFILLNVTSVFIASDVARKYQFDTEISIGEDSKYIIEIILEKEKYGVLQSALYHIRKRDLGNSLTQAPDARKYTKTIERYYQYLPVLSMEKYGQLIPFIQYSLINGLKYRAMSSRELPLTAEEKAAYIENVIALIKEIDDEIILKTNVILAPTKLYLLKLKYDRLPVEDLHFDQHLLYFKSHLVGNMRINRVQLHQLDVIGDTCTIKGALLFPLEGETKLLLHQDDQVQEIQLIDTHDYDRVSFNGDLIIGGKDFEVTVPLIGKRSKLTFDVVYEGHNIQQKPAVKDSLLPLKDAAITRGDRTVELKARTIIIKK